MFGELPAAPALLALAWLAQAWRLSAHDAFFRTPILFAVCCIFVYPFRSRFLHRRPGAMVALASGLSLCWSLAEYVSGESLP